MKNKEKNNKKGIFTYIGRYKLAIFGYVIGEMCWSVTSILATILLADSIQFITQDSPDYKKAILYLLFTAGLYLIRRLSYMASRIIYAKYSNKIINDINLDLAKQAFKLNSRTYADHGTGTFVQRILDDPSRILANIDAIFEDVSEVLNTFIIIVYITCLHPLIGVCAIAVVLIGCIIEFYRNRFHKNYRKILHKKYDKISSLTTEIVRSEKDIKSLGLEQKLDEVSKECYVDYGKASAKHDTINTIFYSTRNTVIEIAGILILILGIYLHELGLITISTYMILFQNNSNFYSFIWCLGNMISSIVEIKVSSDRIFSLYDEEEFVTEKFGDKKLETVVGDIEFKDVSYTFVEYENNEGDSKSKKKEPRKIASENKIFDQLSFKIDHNTTVAFVGKSGSGKSTILNLMSKMYEVTEGEVLIDGTNINDLDKQTLRSTISLVNQFPYIFDMTIKENLSLAKADATDEEIEEAIKEADLSEFISTLKNGVDTKVGESGIKLSGGQKQRLAIARALLRNSPIIIFDESTSSLDNFSQEEIKKTIDGLKGKSTIIIVAHRLSTIKNVDKIFFLDEGKIVDEGTFDQLFKTNEKFKRMFLAENI